MRRLLIISFYFPPIMSAGSVRTGKFAKYLPAFGWEPLVLTVQPKSFLATGIPVEIEETSVFRTPYRDPVGVFSKPGSGQGEKGAPGSSRDGNGFRHSLREKFKAYSPFTIQRLPDRMMGWYWSAVRAGQRILRWDRIDAIFSSHPTPVSHLIAASLRKKFRVPWVADYRDLWTGSTLRPYPQWLEEVEKRMERRVVAGASELVTVSEPLKKYLMSLHHKNVEVIYNGFDPEDFEGEARRGHPSVFTLVYSGTLYTSRQSPVPLFAALKYLMDAGNISKENFRARFIGVQEPPFASLVKRYGLEEVVKREPFQPYELNVATLKGADALLFFSWNEGEMKGNPTSKIFQYMGAFRPVLMVGDANQFVADLITQSKMGEVGKDPRDVAAILSRWVTSWRDRGEIDFNPDRSVVNRFDRRKQAGVLARILDRLA